MPPNSVAAHSLHAVPKIIVDGTGRLGLAASSLPPTSHAVTLRHATGTVPMYIRITHTTGTYQGTIWLFACFLLSLPLCPVSSKGRVQWGRKMPKHFNRWTTVGLRRPIITKYTTRSDSQGYAKPLMRRSTLPPFRPGNFASCVSGTLSYTDLEMLCFVPSAVCCTLRCAAQTSGSFAYCSMVHTTPRDCDCWSSGPFATNKSLGQRRFGGCRMRSCIWYSTAMYVRKYLAHGPLCVPLRLSLSFLPSFFPF